MAFAHVARSRLWACSTQLEALLSFANGRCVHSHSWIWYASLRQTLSDICLETCILFNRRVLHCGCLGLAEILCQHAEQYWTQSKIHTQQGCVLLHSSPLCMQLLCPETQGATLCSCSCCHQQHSMLLIVLYHVHAALTGHSLLAHECLNTPLLCLCCTPLMPGAVGFHFEQNSECLEFAGAYIARQAAKSVVAGGLAKRCLVQISYAIGVAQPLSVYVDTYGTGSIPDKQILAAVLKAFDFRPGMSLLC